MTFSCLNPPCTCLHRSWNLFPVLELLAFMAEPARPCHCFTTSVEHTGADLLGLPCFRLQHCTPSLFWGVSTAESLKLWVPIVTLPIVAELGSEIYFFMLWNKDNITSFIRGQLQGWNKIMLLMCSAHCLTHSTHKWQQLLLSSSPSSSSNGPCPRKSFMVLRKAPSLEEWPLLSQSF